MLKTLLFYQGEVLYTIHIIPGLLYKGVSLILVLGIIFLSLALLLFLISKRKKINLNKYLIILCLIFWAPLFINFLFNNYLDFLENKKIFKYDIEKKRIARLCHMDNASEYYCKVFSFLTFAKNYIPSQSRLGIIAFPTTYPYFQYYSYPYFNIVKDLNKADYLLFYLPEEYYSFENNELFKFEPGKKIKIGNYFVVNNFGPNMIIFKRLNR